MITAARQPTALTIRHSRFATLTLAKLVASLALHPPSSATGSSGLAPHQSGQARQLLLKEKPFGGLFLLDIANRCVWFPQPITARGAADSAAGCQGVRSQTEGEKFKRTDGACADPDPRIFPAPGAMRQVGDSAACQFYQHAFYVAHRFFVTFLVRPALLPYGKRGFRAAICKIARPQPPAATL